MSTEPLDPAMVDHSSLFDEADFDKTIITQMPGNLLPASDGLFLKSHNNSYRLPLGAMVIGRDASCTLSLPSRMISRHHAVIYRQGKHYLLRDLHSTNGVSVNDKPVAQTLLRPGDRITMGDQHFEITEGQHPPEKYNTACIVVFLDLANSTHLTEKYGKAFSEHIRHLMRLVEDQVLIQRGCPVKQLGDGLMCAFELWHVKEAGYQPFDRALQFAQKAVRMFSEDHMYEPLALRVGLHYGDIVLSETPHFDLFGDTVNTAARIEAANKHYQTQIMVSETFVARTGFQDYLREVDRVKVMGRDQPLTLYTWDSIFAKQKQKHHRLPYEQALVAYREGDWDTAKSILARGQSQDPLCTPLLERLQSIDKTPRHWQGIWSLDK
jgi:class 3 adenylate cyclase